MQVHITPRASRDQIEGWRDGVLRVRVAAPPLEGRANQALLRLIADALQVAPSRVRLVAGAASRTKLVEVEGWSAADLRAALAGSAGAVSRRKRSPSE